MKPAFQVAGVAISSILILLIVSCSGLMGNDRYRFDSFLVFSPLLVVATLVLLGFVFQKHLRTYYERFRVWNDEIGSHPQPKLDKDKETSDDTFPSDHLATPSNEPNTLGCFYEWILNSTIIFAACAFVISLFGYFTADDPITEQINMGTLLISGAIVGLLTAVRWLMGAMSTHLSNQAQIIQLMSKKDGDE